MNQQKGKPVSSAFQYFALHKPFGVISQFSDEGGQVRYPTLKSCHEFPRNVYPVGRLDADTEGLLLLTNDPAINKRLLHPDAAVEKVYFVLVSGIPSPEALQHLTRGGIEITHKGQKHVCLPAKVALVPQPDFLERSKPVVVHGPSAWLRIGITEGKNRQVRKMTAAIGHPTLRLIRVRINGITLGDLPIGAVREYSRNQWYKALFGK
jgi:23S rRNA pseudouridine2457 synthase